MFMRYASDAVGHRTGRGTASIVAPATENPSDDEMDVDPPANNNPQPLDEEPGPDGPENAEGSSSSSESSDSSDSEDEDDGAQELATGNEPTDEDLIEAAGYDVL